MALSAAVLALTALLALTGKVLGGPTAQPAAFPYGVSVTAAFLAGVLAILSPCSGAILPAFFGFALERPRGARLGLVYAFWLGLSAIFVPLGFATSLVAVAFAGHRDLIFAAGGVVLLGLGAATLLDLGSTLGRWTGPAAARGQARLAAARTPEARAFGMGLVFGFATSSCTAPILGALQTLALGTAADSLQAMGLMFVFSAGVVAPMVPLAWAFDRARLAGLRRTVRVGGRAVPLARLLAGLTMLALGAAFLAFRGTLDLTGRYDLWGATGLYADLNDALARGTAGALGWLLPATLLLGLGAAWWLRRPRAGGVPGDRGRGPAAGTPRNRGR